MQELANPGEWLLAGMVALGVFIFLRWDLSEKDERTYHRALRVVLILTLCVLVIISVVFVGTEQ